MIKSRVPASIGLIVLASLLVAPMAWGQVAKESLKNIGSQLAVQKDFFDRMPEQSRRALSGSARNIHQLAKIWPDLEKRLLSSPPRLNQLHSQLGSSGFSEADELTETGPVRVSSPANDFAFGPTQGFTQSETSTAWCGSNAVVGFNDSGSFFESLLVNPSNLSFNGVAVSSNQGASFQDLGFLSAGTSTTSFNFLEGDPVLGCPDASTFYYSSIFFTSSRTTFTNAVSVSKSTDGGFTFAPPVIAAGKDAVTHFLDKDFMAVNPLTGNEVAVTYTDFDFSGQVCGFAAPGIPNERVGIELVFSKDGGSTWSAPAVVDQVCSVAPDFPFVQGSQVTFGPEGQVYVAWEFFGSFSGPREIRIRKARHLGTVFLPIVKVSDVTFIGDSFAVEGGFRTFLDLSGLAVDRSLTGTRGSLYVVWHDGRNLPVSFSGFPYNYSDVLLSKSRNGGVTWSTPVRVNNNVKPLPTGLGTDQYQPGVAVDRTGKVGVCWYDRRNDPLNLLVDRFCGTSADGGTTFSNVRVTTSSWAPIHGTDDIINPFYLGDYDTVASDATLSTPGFIGAFQIVSAEGTVSGTTVLVPNPDVWAVTFD